MQDILNGIIVMLAWGTAWLVCVYLPIRIALEILQRMFTPTVVNIDARKQLIVIPRDEIQKK
jgi:hypothetical protein